MTGPRLAFELPDPFVTREAAKHLIEIVETLLAPAEGDDLTPAAPGFVAGFNEAKLAIAAAILSVSRVRDDEVTA